MTRERTAAGKRGKVTYTWAASSSVAFFRASPPLGSVMTFQFHSRTGYSLQSTLISLLMVELSPSLRRRSTRVDPSLTTSKSYLGLPQLCVRQPGGTPFVPTGILDQSSTTSFAPCADTHEAIASTSSNGSQPLCIRPPLCGFGGLPP